MGRPRPATVGGIETELVPAPDRASAEDADDAESDGRGPGRGIRRFVGGFLGLFLLGGLIGVEAWPLTGWKMYARLRHGDFWGWQVRAVGTDGSERSVDLRHAPAAYHGVTHFLSDFEGLPATERQSVCLALGPVARAQHQTVAAVAIDHVLGRIPVDPGGPPSPSTRRVRVHQCELE
ncbi:MAG: hypothetical protein AB1679_05655 [Actinomycetota bacterium]